MRQGRLRKRRREAVVSRLVMMVNSPPQRPREAAHVAMAAAPRMAPLNQCDECGGDGYCEAHGAPHAALRPSIVNAAHARVPR
jgi:hypothetical protein